MRLLLVIVASLCCASPSSAISLDFIGKGSIKPAVYRPCETQAVIYDARPEMGISFAPKDTDFGALDAIDIRLARIVLEMDVMEPTEKPGIYDSAYLSRWDKIVDDCRRQGVCLCVAIHGDAVGVDKVDAKAQTERLARFAADMAARYPSVMYWEFGENMNSCLDWGHYMILSASPAIDAKAVEQGGICAQMLRTVATSVKTVNPSAKIVCKALTDGFFKGVCGATPPALFDVICTSADSKRFTESAEAMRKAMSPTNTGTPLWCVYTDGFEKTKLDEAFTANNKSLFYQKILVENTGPVEQSAWLLREKVNSAIDVHPRNAVNVFIPTKEKMIPIGYSYRHVEGGVEIQRVVVDSLVPTIIQLIYAPEPAPAKPGTKPAPKKDGPPMPDPWDI